MRKAEIRLAEEAHRVTLYLSPGTEPKLKHLSETELITLHARTLVEMEGSGSICLMRDDKLEDLKRMYALFSRVPATLDILRGNSHSFVLVSYVHEHVLSCAMLPCHVLFR